MESKIFIDINYASRDPQIVIQRGHDSDDPRDKLITMLVGQAMPGVRDGYCRIERSERNEKVEIAIITPLDPGEAIKHIPAIKEFALSSAVCDTAGYKERVEIQDLEAVDVMCKERLGDLDFKEWQRIRKMLILGRMQ